MKIEVGQIWEVITDNFLTSGDDDKKNSRQLKIYKGEKIEIRYPYEWHFRTEKNEYYHAKSEMIINNCALFGIIKPEINRNNKAKLEEIIRLELYKQI